MEVAAKRSKNEPEVTLDPTRQIMIQFVDPDGNPSGPEIDIPINTSKATLEEMLNSIVETEEVTQYNFSLNENTIEIVKDLYAAIQALQQGDSSFSTENILKVQFHPLSVFRVRPVTRCTSTMTGHSEAVLQVAFSPDCSVLATASGDTTVRLWDMGMNAPRATLTGHKTWVMSLAWAPDGTALASACLKGVICTWTPEGKPFGPTISRHSQVVTALAWQPLHLLQGDAEKDLLLASASKDQTVRIWHPRSGTFLKSFSSHTQMVTGLRWSGEGEHGYLYSCGRDRKILVWNPEYGTLVKDLQGHAHWVNSLALSTDHVLKTGAYSLEGPNTFSSRKEMRDRAKQRYDECVKAVGGERLLSCSDDNTMFLWAPTLASKPIIRMTGHQRPVNHAAFSPDGRFIASASFDKSVRLWDGRSGKFIHVFRGHVAEVYQIAWSADSRMFISACKDSTGKVWDATKKKLKEDLFGHADEVYTVDWAADGSKAASGSKDRTIKIWTH